VGEIDGNERGKPGAGNECERFRENQVGKKGKGQKGTLAANADTLNAGDRPKAFKNGV